MKVTYQIILSRCVLNLYYNYYNILPHFHIYKYDPNNSHERVCINDVSNDRYKRYFLFYFGLIISSRVVMNIVFIILFKSIKN